MKSLKLLALAIGASSVLLSGCAQFKTARIISQDNAQVAITLNKGYTVSVIALKNGERIASCTLPNPKGQEKREPTDNDCPIAKKTLNKTEKILYRETYNVTVTEGSTCVSIWIGNHEFEFCDPPYDLSF